MSAIPMDETHAPSAVEGSVARALWALSLCLVATLGVQALVLAALSWQEQLPTVPRLIADAVQLLVWATATGAALLAAQALTRRRWLLAIMGLGGAALAVVAARGAQVAALAALTGGDIHGTTLWSSLVLRGVEFAVLAALLSTPSPKPAGALLHGVAGAAIGGLAFLAGLVVLPAAGDALPRAIAEIGVPTGIALALFVTQSSGPRRP